MTRKLLVNSGINLLGSSIPIILTLLAIPLLIKALGMEQFGFLSLSWAIIGYLSLLDFGLGRALSQQTAANYNNKSQITQTFWDTHTLIASLGSLGSLIIALITSWFFNQDNNPNPALQHVVWASIFMIFPSLLINSLSYFLIALEKFILLNLLKSSLSSLNIIIPILICQISSPANTFEHIMEALSWLRWLFSIIFFLACIYSAPYLLKIKSWHFHYPAKLIKLGGWMTITNIVGPIMTYFDRFFIASLISPTAVGAYSIAYELSSKLNIIAAALSTALAPFFAKQKNQPNLITQTFILSSITITGIFIPLIGCISAYGDLLLHWWLKQDEIKIIHQTTQWLALGFFFNAIALIFYTHLQFMERPDITAKIHLIELPFYLGLLIILLIHQGVIGAAIAWTVRAAIDMLLLLIYSLRINRNHITCAISI